MAKIQHGKRSAGYVIVFGIIASVVVLISGAWYLFSLGSVVFKLSAGFLVCDFFFGLCFGIAMAQAMAQSRPYRREAVSTTSTFKAIGIGVISGLAFIVRGILLGMLYVLAKPPSGEFHFVSLVVCGLIGATLSAAIGAIFYVPLVGLGKNELAVLFIDHGGVPIYFTGAIGGCVGAILGVIDSTQALAWWIRIPAALLAGVGGAAYGFYLVGSRLDDLFTLPFVWGVDDTVVAPVGETEFQDAFLGNNGRYEMVIHPTMIPHIRYIAAYRLAPESAITHLARVKSIKQCKRTGEERDQCARYILHISTPATAISPIRLAPGGKVSEPRRPVYTARSYLLKAQNLDEAFPLR